MLLDNKELSAVIRMKKKKMMEADPEIVDTSPTPDMNAQDVWDLEKKAYVETMLDSPKKINADDTSMNEPGDMEIKKMQDARMARLRAYMNQMDI